MGMREDEGGGTWRDVEERWMREEEERWRRGGRWRRDVERRRDERWREVEEEGRGDDLGNEVVGQGVQCLMEGRAVVEGFRSSSRRSLSTHVRCRILCIWITEPYKARTKGGMLPWESYCVYR